MFFQTNTTTRRQSHDSGLESILDNADTAEGVGQASQYVNTTSLVPPGPNATTAQPGVAPRRPPKSWRGNSENQQAYLNQPGSEGSGSAEQNLIDLDEDQESGDVLDEREPEGSGSQGKTTVTTVSTTTSGPLVEKVTSTPAIDNAWSPEVRGIVERPSSPYDVYVELRHSDGMAQSRLFWMDRCESQGVLTRSLRRDDYFCTVSLNLLFSPVKSVCGEILVVLLTISLD